MHSDIHFKNPLLKYSHRRVMDNVLYLFLHEYLIAFIFRIFYRIFNSLLFSNF